MNHEQWTALQEATRGHTPGPWEVQNVSSTPCVFCASRATNILIEGWGGVNDIHLAAAAPDLLAEVERLRGWLDEIESHVAYGGLASEQIQLALNGAEVPK